ncbi:structural maintenance of chromosomes protein 5-like [Ruditapes philippinarum]|uniref:structural maintenance of chromosomes protein 5-like n=1 Tax=Ruditapes philippinarum TaxID=129788 RepID=UPI00295AEED9|nr:structural maintenance of chromosomes protein 5-like [Ruditapes philippinarum]
MRKSVVSKDAKYCEGSIVKIKLENVLTYDSVEFKCGPHLNVVIGPNGTGKSTIVCAICLGLAGKTSWLGRAQSPTDFIKYGKSKARIELELYNSDGDNWTIAREINKEGQQTRWWVNGRAATQKAVEELVSRLNIQVGNLTQFLPQEKVADFAKMSESELLENTEKAVGDPEMYERHQKLKESRTNAKSLEQEFQNLQERINQEVQKNARIEQDVKNFEERENFLAKIATLEIKKAWVKYECERLQYMSTKEEKEQKEKKLKEIRAAHAPLMKKLDDAKKNKESIDNMMKTKGLELKEAAKKAEANGKEGDNLTDKYVEAQDELKFKKDQEDARKKRVRDLNKQLEALENELQNTEETEDVQPLLEKVNRGMRETQQKLGHINMEGENLRGKIEGRRRNINGMSKDLQALRNIENQRLQTLRAKHKDTYDAVMWLRENRDKFKGNIHEPIMLCVNMKDPHMAKYLENHISFNDMRAFVCDTSEDMNTFMDLMREDQKLRVNAVKTPPRVSLDTCHPKHPIQQYRKYGFHSYLMDLFTCPEAVMKFLCTQYKVQSIPVGDNRTKELVDKIVKEQPDLNCFYTADNQYMIKKSRYDGSTSSRSVKLKNPTLLTVSMDDNREKELVNQIQIETESVRKEEDLYNNMKVQSRQLDKHLNELREDRKSLMTRKDIKKKLQSQISAKKQTIQNVEGEAIDLDAEEKKVAKKFQDINAKKFKNLQQYLENTQKCVKASTEKVRMSLRHAETIREYNRLEADIREQSQTLQSAESEFERIKEKLRNCKEVAKRLLLAAKRASGTGPDEEVSPSLKSTFAGLPDTIEEIDNCIHEHQVRADCTVQTDERVVREFKRRKEEIERLETQLANKEQERDSHQATIEEAKSQWLDPLQELIGRINKSFSHFFSCLKCVGEVDLHIPDNPEEYSKYGVRIRVKFRDSEQLRELSPFHQSGGERSVTTVLYMMSLQELAKCPFRCVDEINQGMDPHNERKVFELVVNTVCNKSASQYFLLTPKLLPDLEYAKNMTVLCVYNGPDMLNHKDWNLKKFLQLRARLED